MAAVLVGGVVMVTQTGCGGGGGVNGGAAYVQQFARGDYAAAKATALADAERSGGIERDRATLIAGLSAAQLKQNAEAVRLLSPLTTHNDNEIAGRAIAGTGLVARNQGDKSRAATLLADGAKKLTGDTGARAYLASGDAFAELGRKSEAQAQYTSGLGLAQSADLKAALAERATGKRFTVQVGAFSSRANADKRAKEVRGQSISLGLGEPRVFTAVTNGKTTYVVQLGDFPTKQDARNASAKIGGASIATESDAQ